MNGPNIVGATYLDPISIDWQIQGTGDFSGDGRSDILWRNTNPRAIDAGWLYVWIMNGPTVTAGTAQAAPFAMERRDGPVVVMS